jgi:hypothetical protein
MMELGLYTFADIGPAQRLRNLQKPLATCLTAFARRRSGVRFLSAPLLKVGVLQVKRLYRTRSTACRG